MADLWTRRHSEISTPALLTAYHLHSIALELRISNNYYSDFAASRGKGVSLEWSAPSMSRALIVQKPTYSLPFLTREEIYFLKHNLRDM